MSNSHKHRGRETFCLATTKKQNLGTSGRSVTKPERAVKGRCQLCFTHNSFDNYDKALATLSGGGGGVNTTIRVPGAIALQMCWACDLLHCGKLEYILCDSGELFSQTPFKSDVQKKTHPGVFIPGWQRGLSESEEEWGLGKKGQTSLSLFAGIMVAMEKSELLGIPVS